MKKRYDLIKDEIMYLISLSPEAKHSVGGLHDRLKDKVTRTEIERAVACLMARQHIKKLGGYVFGFGTGEDIKPFDLDYDPNALPTMKAPEVSNKDRIARAEQKRHQQTQSKTAQKQKSMQAWAGGPKQQEKPPASPAPTAKPEPAPVITPDADINYALAEMRDRLSAPRQVAIKNLPRKINALEQLADMAPPNIGQLLNEIKDDLKGVAA